MRAATWRAGGATVTQVGGKIFVEGTSSFAADLRSRVAMPRGSLSVAVAPPPGGYVRVDPRSAWLVDAWVRAEAARNGYEVATDFVPGRPPRSVAQLRAEARRAPEFDEDGKLTVFSTLPRMLTAAERRRPIASKVVRAALEEARALPPYSRGDDEQRRAIVDRVNAELRGETDEDERWRLRALVWDALGFGIE